MAPVSPCHMKTKPMMRPKIAPVILILLLVDIFVNHEISILSSSVLEYLILTTLTATTCRPVNSSTVSWMRFRMSELTSLMSLPIRRRG